MFFTETRVYKYHELNEKAKRFAFKSYFAPPRAKGLSQEISNIIEDRTGTRPYAVEYRFKKRTLELDFKLDLMHDVVINESFDSIVDNLPATVFQKLFDTQDELILKNDLYYWRKNSDDKDFEKVAHLIYSLWYLPLKNEMEQFAQDCLYRLPELEMEKAFKDTAFFYVNGSVCSQQVKKA